MSTTAVPALRGRVVVVSPHLDDAVLSLGATMWQAARSGAEIVIVTVLAGDPASQLPAGEWDAAAGFSTAGDASRVRRDEDRAACASLGATPQWLPYSDVQYPRGGDAARIGEDLAAALADADVVLFPGYPLRHADHAFVAELVLGSPVAAPRLGLYVEQPYAADHRLVDPAVPPDLLPISGVPRWVKHPVPRAARAAKRRAAMEYRSQRRMLRAVRTLRRIARHEAALGGETIGWLEDRP